MPRNPFDASREEKAEAAFKKLKLDRVLRERATAQLRKDCGEITGHAFSMLACQICGSPRFGLPDFYAADPAFHY